MKERIPSLDSFISESVIQDKSTEINTHAHLMNAEGSCDDKPSDEDIIKYIKARGYIASGIEIAYDGFQKVWRWHCDISKK